MSEEVKIPHYVKRALKRLETGRILVREVSHTEEARKGEGYVYFTLPDGKPFAPVSGAYCVREGLVTPLHDGLFAEASQSFRLSS